MPKVYTFGHLKVLFVNKTLKRNNKLTNINSMRKYVITLTESGEETVVGCYDTLDAAKSHLRNVRYYPEYRRTEECLEIDSDGMSGTGYDETGYFTYNIKAEIA